MIIGIVLGVIGVSTIGYAQSVTAANAAGVAKIITYHDVAYQAGVFSEYSQGSAVALGQNLLVTNAHVVMDDDRTIMQNIAVCVITGLVIDPPECSVVASVLAIDINKDIAILQTKYPVGALVPVTIADDDMELGESVAVLGYPANGGSTITYTEGKISGQEGGWYKMDANLDAGNSGGGAFNNQGELVGIPTSVSQGYTTLGYMIPASTIRYFLDNNTQSLPVTTSDHFASFVAARHRDTSAHDINNNFFAIEDFDRYGFTLIDSVVNAHTNTYQYLFSSLDGNTILTIAANQQYVSPNDPGVDIQTQIGELQTVRKRVVYKEDVEFMDRVWDVLYLDGYKRSNEIDKVLQFTQKGKYNVLYTYTIHTQSTSLDDMFNALNILVNAYSMEEHTGSRDLRTFGELYLPDFMSLGGATIDGQGVTMSASYGDGVGGALWYDTVGNEWVDTTSHEDSVYDPCTMKDTATGCDSFWIRNDNNIPIMIATYTDEESDRFYVGTIIDAYQDDYVAYNFIFITDDSYQYNKRVKDFFQQIDSDEIERVFDSSPSFQASW